MGCCYYWNLRHQELWNARLHWRRRQHSNRHLYATYRCGQHVHFFHFVVIVKIIQNLVFVWLFRCGCCLDWCLVHAKATNLHGWGHWSRRGRTKRRLWNDGWRQSSGCGNHNVQTIHAWSSRCDEREGRACVKRFTVIEMRWHGVLDSRADRV